MHVKLMLVLMLMNFVQNDQAIIYFLSSFYAYAASLRFAFYFLLMQDQAGWCNWFPPPYNTIAELGKVSCNSVYFTLFSKTENKQACVLTCKKHLSCSLLYMIGPLGSLSCSGCVLFNTWNIPGLLSDFSDFKDTDNKHWYLLWPSNLWVVTVS